jgi:hypothetical protein
LRHPPSQRRVPAIPMMRAEAQAAFRAWMEKLDKIRY